MSSFYSVKELEPGNRDGNGKYGRYVHGKINMPGTANMRSNHSNRIVCEFDEFSKNNIYNRIIKTTAKLLLGKNVADNIGIAGPTIDEPVETCTRGI